MRGRIFGAMAGLSVCLVAMTATAQDYTLRLAMIPAPKSAYSNTMHAIPERVAEATDGRVKVEVYDSLVPLNQLHTAVRDGRIDMSAIINTFLSSEEPRLTLSNLPGLVETMPEYRKLYDSYWGASMEQVFREKYNAVLLGHGVWAPQVLMSRVPLHTIEDLQGKKVRVHNTEVAFLINELGGRSTPLAPSEMLAGLERGVVDGVITSVVNGINFGFGDVAKHVQFWPFGTLTGWSIVINQDTWNKLPPDVQAQIRGAIDELIAEHLANFDNNVDEYLAKWREKGAEVYVVPEEERSRALSDKYTRPVFEAWDTRLDDMGLHGDQILQDAKAALAN